MHWEHFIVASIKQRKPFFFHFLNLESLFNIPMLHWQSDCQTESQANPYILRLIPHIFKSKVLDPHLVATVALLPNCRVCKDSLLLHLDRQKTPLNHVNSKGIWCRQTCPSPSIYVKCNKNPNTKLKIPAAMRAKDIAMMMQQVERYRHKFVVQWRRLSRANHRLRIHRTTCSCLSV